VSPAERPRFSLWATGEWPGEPLRLKVGVEIDGREAKLKLTGLQTSGRREGAFPDGLALWEIDWENDGQGFCSRWQAARAWRSPELQLETSHRYRTPGRKRLGVRVFDLLGRMGLAELEVRAA
jgi:hypothetical protein